MARILRCAWRVAELEGRRLVNRQNYSLGDIQNYQRDLQQRQTETGLKRTLGWLQPDWLPAFWARVNTRNPFERNGLVSNMLAMHSKI